MKAIVLPEYGPPSALALRVVPEPMPNAGEIKVRVAAAGVNPIDWKLRGGAYQKYMPLPLPAILGKDVSGVVVALGDGVTAPPVGARVLGFVNQGYAEYVVAPAGAFAELPPRLDLVEAAALPLALLTGAQLVEEATGVSPGQTVLVTGATGAVGRVAVFVARAWGAKVYAGVRAAHAAEAKKLGVEGVVALDDEGGLATLPQLDALADTVGGASTQKVLERLAPGARIGSVVGEPEGAKARGFDVRPMLTHPDAKRLGELASEVAAGRLVIPIAKRFPLAEAARAHEAAEKGGGGKVLLTL